MSDFDISPDADKNMKPTNFINALNEITGADELADKKKMILEQLKSIEVKIDDEKYLDFIIKTDENEHILPPKTQAEIVNEIYGWEDILSDRMEIEAALRKLNFE